MESWAVGAGDRSKMESLPLRSWATLPFDNPLNTYVAVSLDTARSRITSFGSIWFLRYLNNRPVELIKSRFKSINRADSYRENLKYLLSHCETGSTIYLPTVFYRYAQVSDRDTDLMMIVKKAELKLLPPHILWDIVKGAVKEDLDSFIRSEEQKTWKDLGTCI